MSTIAAQFFGLLLVLLLFCAGCSDTKTVKASSNAVADAKTAREAFSDHLAKHGSDVGTISSAEYEIKVELFCDSIWLVSAKYKKDPEGRAVVYIVDGNGVRKATLQNLIYAHAKKFPASSDEKDHRSALGSVIRLHSSHDHRGPVNVISSTHDIPGYNIIMKGMDGNRIGGPLDVDLEKVIRPAWKQERRSGEDLFYIVYTYNQVGGVVSRYKFQFHTTPSRDSKGSFNQWRIYAADHIVLGTMVGEFQLRD